MVRKRIVRVISVISFLIVACQFSSTVSPLLDQNNPPIQVAATSSKQTNSSNLPAPDITEEQSLAFSSNASAVLTNLPYLDEINQGLYPEIQKELYGLYLTVSQVFPMDFRKSIEEIKNDPSNPKKLAGYQTFFDQADELDQQEKINLISHTIDEFGLYPNMPKRLQVEYTTMTLDFDPTTYQSNIRIRILEPSDLTLNNDVMNRITVTGSLFDPNTFDVMPYGILELAGEPVLEQKDVSGLPPQFFLNIPVHGAMEWGLVYVGTGAITSDSLGDEVGYFLIAKGPYGLHRLMAMRPLPLDEQGKSFMTPPTYGAPEPKQLPAIPQNQLESVMRQNLENALQKAVDHGDINQDEANNLLAKFDDPQIIHVAKSPEWRAALLLSASIKPAAGDLVLPVALGQNSHNMPDRLVFDGDPELTELFHGNPPANVDPYGGGVYQLDDGSIIFIGGSNLKNGKEPIEFLASLIPHELLVHDDPLSVSLAEETMGNIIQVVAWSMFVQRDPGLLSGETFNTQSSNLLLYGMLNSLNVKDQASYPFYSHVGITSRITSLQTHNQGDYNILPGATIQSGQPIKSFYALIRRFYQQKILSPVSPGTQVTLALIQNLFEAGLVIPDNLDVNNDMFPDFSDLFITDFLDQHVKDLIPDEQFKELAQELHMTLDGRDVTP